jgi:N-acetylmuramoyl-L-alanine amidase
MDKVRIVIDPGHGGDDPGAVNAVNGLREADVALGIAHALKAVLDARPEYEVFLTRDGDETVPLSERTKLANRMDAHLVSIHCNAAEDPSAHGAEVWCFAKTNADGTESEGYRLARAIQDELTALDLADRGAKAIYDRNERKYIGRKLWVLRKTARPAVLVECGFISNPDEAHMLGDAHGDFRQRLAVAVFRGIYKTLNQKGGDKG